MNALTTKTISPVEIIDGEMKITGTQIDYRFLGLLVCRKTLYLPAVPKDEKTDYFTRFD